MKKQSEPQSLSPLEQRLRNEAAAWAEQVHNQPSSVPPPQPLVDRRRWAPRRHLGVLACSLALAAVGIAYWYQPSQMTTVSQAEQAEVANQAEVISQADLAALQATNTAIQKVFGSAAENTRKAVDRQLLEVNRLANESNMINSVSLKTSSSDAIRKWALEPGRRYGAAAQWFDSRLAKLGDSSLSAARRLLNRDAQQAKQAESTENG